MNLTQQLVHHLGQAIVKGSYGAHNPMPSEALLSKELQASRSATREAVKSLAAKGLLRSRARQGIRVLPESEWNLFDTEVLGWIRHANPSLALLREFSELRLAVEPHAAYLAAGRQRQEEIVAIRRDLERMGKAEQGQDDPLESDIAFHVAILNASGNRFLSQLGRIIDATLRVSITHTNRLSGVQAASYAEHKPILDAILAADPPAARAASAQLIGDAIALIDKAITKDPEGSQR